ncbi:MAG: transporter-related protein [Chthoniobacteraceae bacterium]|nr:transporter-related protein [Chthoniobacteraceae bacterium]
MSEPVIQLSALSKHYGDTLAVDELSLSIARGNIFGFLGANGAGKTTTIRMLCGLTKPSTGSGLITGKDVWKERNNIRSQFGYVAQKFSLYPDLTVAENLQFFGGACRVAPGLLRERVTELLRQTDLEGKRHAAAGSLSGGMKQLLALACALVHRPSILFLDEPTSGLDPVNRQQLWNLLYSLSSDGTTIFVTTHYMDEAERCTDVGFLHKGKLLVKESPRNLKRSFSGRLLEMNVEPVMPALAALRQVPGVLGASLRSGRIRIYSAVAEQLVADWTRAWPFPDFQWLGHEWGDADMEDVFSAYSQDYHQILTPRAEQREQP